MNDDVIDLTKYLAQSPAEAAAQGARGNFSVWGGDGERSRFALPIWRSIYLVGGRRGGLVSLSDAEDAVPEPLFVLDLAAEPARTDFEVPETGPDIGGDAPTLLEDGDTVAVFLGTRGGQSWFLVVDDLGEEAESVTAGTREDLLFLAGECAGLLFFRELADAGEDLDLD